MTNPRRVTIPEGVKRFPDVERAVVTIIQNFCKQLTPPAAVGTMPPANADVVIASGAPVVVVTRAGGAATRVIDEARVSVTVTTGYRSDSWEVMGWLRSQLYDFTGFVENPDGSTAIIETIMDAQGPQRAVAPQTDHRTVSAMFSVHTRLER